MKKLFLLVAVVAILLPSCKKINEAIDGLDSRLDKLEQETIPSIDEQISAINTTLGNLDAMDKELKGYIDNLTTTASSLQEQINATNAKIEEVKTGLQSEISTAKSEVLAQLATAKTELENELKQINATIETLKEKDKELDNKIAELRSYVDTELGETTDWVNATFATLEQYNSLVSEIATIKEQIKAINQSITDLETRLTTKINEDIANAVSTLNADIKQKVSEITTAYTTAIKSAKEEITAAYTTAIQNAINALDVSLKAWVGEQLANYYTIAEVEAKISALQTAITEGDASLQEELKSLKSQLETTATEITTAYKKAIEEAITTNNGVIDTKIANEIASVNQRITNEVATINAKIAEIESRLDNVEAKIAELLARIQSVSYIPTYDDGKATVVSNGTTSQVTLDFEVSPKDAVVELAKVWQSAVSVKAVYTQTRAVSFIDMPIVKFESDAVNGVISITASAENLSADFFALTQSASARLSISDGNNTLTSEYIPLYAGPNPQTNIVFEDLQVKALCCHNWDTNSDGELSYAEAAAITDIGTVFREKTNIIAFTELKYFTGITELVESAFAKCAALWKIEFPANVKKVEQSAFTGCTSLSRVYISNLSAWCTIEFMSASSNPLYYEATLYLNDVPISDLSIPTDVTHISMFAFYKCQNLTSITIPNSVTSIGDYAFRQCRNLTSITIPDSVTSIGKFAFYGCSSLASVTIPNSVTSIGNSAFSSCSSLTSVYISDLSAWCKIDFDSSFSNPLYNGAKLYLNGSELSQMSIPSGITEIKPYTFYRCSSLTSVTIPNSITSIGNGTFSGCSSLTSVYCKPTTPPTGGSNIFNNNATERMIYVPRNSVDAYKSAEYWSDYADNIVGYDFE